jgi:hypothetical protein
MTLTCKHCKPPFHLIKHLHGFSPAASPPLRRAASALIASMMAEALACSRIDLFNLLQIAQLPPATNLPRREARMHQHVATSGVMPGMAARVLHRLRDFFLKTNITTVSGSISICQPVSLEVSRAFCPRLPMASESWSSPP